MPLSISKIQKTSENHCFLYDERCKRALPFFFSALFFAFLSVVKAYCASLACKKSVREQETGAKVSVIRINSEKIWTAWQFLYRDSKTSTEAPTRYFLAMQTSSITSRSISGNIDCRVSKVLACSCCSILRARVSTSRVSAEIAC